MPTTEEQEQGDDRVKTADSNTLQTSQDDQAKGYLESLADGDFIAELQSALKHAKRLTKKSWKVTITADEVAIESSTDKTRIKLPKPKTLGNN